MYDEKKGQKELVMSHLEVSPKLCLLQPQEKRRFLSLNYK